MASGWPAGANGKAVGKASLGNQQAKDAKSGLREMTKAESVQSVPLVSPGKGEPPKPRQGKRNSTEQQAAAKRAKQARTGDPDADWGIKRIYDKGGAFQKSRIIILYACASTTAISNNKRTYLIDIK